MKKYGILKPLPFSVLAIALALRMASADTANLSYLVLAGYALQGRAQAIQALALSWLFSMLSEGVAPLVSLASVGRYAVVIGATISVLFRFRHAKIRMSVSRLMRATLALGSFLVIHSCFFSPMLDISVLKALLWTVTMITLIAAWTGLSPDARDSLAQQLFTGLIVVMLVSLPLLVLPVGYLTNGSGFQGVFGQPQAFGPTMALLGAWAASRGFGHKQPAWRDVVLVMTCLVLVVLSEARTAGFALVLGVGIAVMMLRFLSDRPIRALLPGLYSGRLHLMIGLVLLGALLAGPMLIERVDTFITKGQKVTDFAEAYEASRGGQIKNMWANIVDNPLSGIGFGLASIPYTMFVRYDPVLGFPISASIEKGVLPVAVLEEIGVLGFVLVAGWIWMILRRSARGGIVPFSVSITIFMTNMGESTLFSPSGLGLIMLIMLGWALASGQREGQ